MSSERWPWLGAAALLGGSAVTAGWSAWLYWEPCRGGMLVGSILKAASARHDFTDVCLQRMDAGTPFGHDLVAEAPLITELSVAALILCSAAWLMLVIGLPWSWRTRTLASLVSVPGLASALSIVTGLGARLSDNGYGVTLLWLLSTVAFIAILAVFGLPLDLRDAPLTWVLIVLWGATAFDLPHQLLDYAIMTGWSSANWDTPPGTGVLTVTALAISAALTAYMSFRPPRRQTAVTTALASPVNT